MRRKMRTSRIKIFSIIFLVMLVVLACSFSASTANIKEAYTARSDGSEMTQTTAFAQDEVFYCVVDVANAPDDTVVKAIWYAVDAEGVDANFVVNETEFTGGGEITFDLSNDQLWPAGKYKVELYLNDELDRTLDFEVVPAASSAPVPEATGASVASAYLQSMKSGSPENTTVFAQDEVFYLVVDVADGADTTAVKATWIAVDVEGADPNLTINETDFQGSGEITFDLSNDQPWPLGSYRVEVSVDGVNQGGLDFQVSQ